jgi:hypothetical protein
MKKEQIETMIDKKIETKFSTGSVPNQVIGELITMSNNINKTLVRDNIDLNDYRGVEWESIDKVRVKYAIHYIKHCNKRIFDMDWVKSKRGKLSINYWEIWRLFVFKEKMTNSKPKINIKSVFQKQLERSKPLTKESIINSKDKKWFCDRDKKVGETPLQAFIRSKSGYFKLVSIALEYLDEYEVDEDYCEKIGYKHMYIPYIKKFKN